MNMVNIFKVGNLQISTPSNWFDITDDIETQNPPFTLARPDGVGAIQFSTAEYRSGKAPNITINDLHKLLEDFSASRKLGEGYDFASQSRALLIVASSYSFEDAFLRVWYASDGQNVALVTYNCRKGQEQTELTDCEEIILSLKFE